MKVIIVYDSQYGNTEMIAKAIGGAAAGFVEVSRADSIDPAAMEGADILVFGSPTHGGRPTPSIQDLIAKIPSSTLKGTRVATFDTRNEGRFVKIFGYAADRMAASLTERGGKLVSPPAAFFVTGKKGPLKDGEIERAMKWARELMQ